MPTDIMVTTTVGTINLLGKEFTEFSDKTLNDYGVKGIGYDSVTSKDETEVYFYGRKTDVERFLREVYGCEAGEEYTYFQNEFQADIIFFNFTIIDRYLQDTGWRHTSQEGLKNGEEVVTHFYDKPASDGTNVRFYFPAAKEGSPIEFSVINYQNLMDGPLDGKSFEENTISDGIDYAEIMVEGQTLSEAAQAWLNRGGNELNLRPEVDY